MVHDHGRAEDVTQEVFISALRRLRATDAPIVFKPWVYEIAKNACIDAFRRSRRAEEVSYDADDNGLDRSRLVSSTPTPDAAVDQRMTMENLQGAFGGLSETHHQILVMRELEGLSYRQIGERLGMSRPSVESTLFRARRRLTEEYDELVSGERCRRVQSIIAQGAPGRLGVRDGRKMSRHVSHCQPCRRAACLAGVDLDRLAPRSARARLAALLPLPGFLRRRLGDTADQPTSAAAHAADAVQLASAAAAYTDPAMSAWARSAVAAVGIAVAGLGAGVATHDGRLGLGARDAGAPVVRSAPAATGAARAPAPTRPYLRRDRQAAAARPAAHRRAESTTASRRPARSAAGAHDTDPVPAGTPAQASAPAQTPSKAGPGAGGASAVTGRTGTIVRQPSAPLPGAPSTQNLPSAPAVPATAPAVSAPAAVGDTVQTATDAVGAAGGTVGGVTDGAGNLLSGG